MSFRKNGYTIALAVFAALLCSSCATLFQGTTEEVMVASDPDAAQVTVNDGRSGPTPFSMRVPRSEDLQIHVSKVGYTPYDMTDTSHVEWGYLVSDIFFTGLIGLAVDGIDGAMFYHNQAMVTAHLDPIPLPRMSQTPAGPQPMVAPAAAFIPAPEAPSPPGRD